MRKYEAMALVRPELSDADVQKIANRFKEVIEHQGGEVESAGKWDKRKLAYEIEGLREANYLLFQFSAPSAAPQEVGRQMRISDDIIRYRIFSVEE